MTIKQCEYVIEVARCGSFCEASNRLFISQSNLSIIIKDLEEELGVKIFNRSNRGVSLTSDGIEFLRSALKIAAQARFVSERFGNNVKKKHFSVYTQHYDFAADAFTEFVNKNAADPCYFIFKETQTDEIIKAVKTNTCDFGLIVIKEGNTQIERYLKNNKIKTEKIGKITPHIFIRKNHPIATKSSVDFKSMSIYPYITYGQGDYGSELFREELIEDDDSIRKIEINDRATLMNLLISTNSFTVGTGIMKSNLNKGKVISIPIKSTDNYSIVILSHENTVCSDTAAEFIMILKKFFAANE